MKQTQKIVIILSIVCISIIISIFCVIFYNANKKYTIEASPEALNIMISEIPTYNININYNYTLHNYSVNYSYNLPLDLNYTDLISSLNSLPYIKSFIRNNFELLKNNGVLIIPGEYIYVTNDFSDAYQILNTQNIPVLVTTDSLMYLYHVEFNEILRYLEETKLYDKLKLLLQAEIKKLLGYYYGTNNQSLKKILKIDIAYLSVALKLLDPNFEPPEFVKEDVEKEIKKIEAHKGFYINNVLTSNKSFCKKVCIGNCIDGEYDNLGFFVKGYIVGDKCNKNLLKECYLKCYIEDYSQYIPRGHYTRSEKLKRYFKAMMWLGRLTFKVNNDDLLKASIILTGSLFEAKVKIDDEEVPAINLWYDIYLITSFFAGTSDDITPLEYIPIIKKVFGSNITPKKLFNKTLLEQFKKEVRKLKSPKILSEFAPDLAGTLEELTKGLRFMGQRFTFDSYALSELVYKNVGVNLDSPYLSQVLTALRINMTKEELKKWIEEDFLNRTNLVCQAALQMYSSQPEKFYSVCRVMPTALDVMSVLGSNFSLYLSNKYYNLSSYMHYEQQLKKLKKEISNYTVKNWTKNLYNIWLWSIKSEISEKDNRYPPFMTSNLWKFKQIITGLGSYAQLRHDTILYVKQSYTWGLTRQGSVAPHSHVPIIARAYVEPQPEVYEKLRVGVIYLKKVLEKTNTLDEKLKSSLDDTEKLLLKLRKISEKELSGKDLSYEDTNFIQNIYLQFDNILRTLNNALSSKYELDYKDMKDNRIIADIHTEGNTKKVFEIGTGNLDYVLVIYPLEKGYGVAIGPIFSYYEFVWPMEDRLTDEKWKDKVMNKVPRPIIYKEANISSSSQPYIVF